jgi:glycosyltransferase involved in cell wall biosynthesis
MRGANIAGEVIIADNGSGDGSIEIAERLGARVAHVMPRGYGNALMAGSLRPVASSL